MSKALTLLLRQENSSHNLQYKIEGFPTIKLLKDNKVYDFDAKPTKDNLNNFINTVVV